MTKKIILSAAVCVMFHAGLFAEPRCDVQEKRDSTRNLTEITRKLYFHEGVLTLSHFTEDGKTPVQKKWGDYFLGLEFGRPPSSNGGWNLWDFFACYRMDKRAINIPREYMPESVTMVQSGGAAAADIVIPSGNGGRLEMRMIQFPSHKKWIFMRVTAKDFQPWRLDLSAYPGNSNTPKERERYIATRENRYCTSRSAAEFVPASPYMILFNKFVQDRYGNMIVFNPGQFVKIVSPKSPGAVLIQFFPKKDENVFFFALGYFADQAADDAVTRFLGEDGDAVKSFMEKIDWEPKLDTKGFEQTVKEAATLGVDPVRLKEFEKEFADIVKRKDVSAASNLMKKLDDLKKTMDRKGLDDFK